MRIRFAFGKGAVTSLTSKGACLIAFSTDKGQQSRHNIHMMKWLTHYCWLELRAS